MRFFFLTIPIICVLSGCGAPQPDDAAAPASSPVSPPVAPAVKPPVQPQSVQPDSRGFVDVGEWKEFSSAPGKFTIMFHGEAVETTSSVQTELGELPSHDFRLKVHYKPHSAVYMLSYSDYPPGGTAKYKPEDFLERTWQGGYGDMSDRLISKKAVTVNGFSSIAFQMHGSGRSTMLIDGLNVLVNDRIYQLTTIMHPDLVAQGEPQKFLDSFKPVA